MVMASSAATWTWSWNATTLSSPSSSFSTFQSRYKRTHLTKFSLDDLTPSSSSSSSSPSDSISQARKGSNSNINNPLTKPKSDSSLRKRPTQIGRSADASFFPVGGGANEEMESVLPPVQQLGPWRLVGLKLFFRKRPLWKRIFFASKKVRSIILLNVLTIIYASNIPVIKEVEEIMDPALFTVVRFTVSAIPFLPFVLKARGDGQIRAAGTELGMWVSLAYITQTLGLVTSDAGRASFITAFTVIVVPLIDGLLGARVPTLTWFGALTSLIGVAMLESSGSPPSVGDILNILSAIFFGIHMLRTEHISRITKKEDFLALLGYEVFVIALVSAIWYFIMDGFGEMHGLTLTSWSWMTLRDLMASFPWIPALYTGIFSTGLCLWVEMAAMCDVSATETAIIYGLEPVWGAAFAWFLLGERWGITGWIGATLVLGGSLTVQIWGSSPKKTKKDEEIPSEKQDSFSVATVVVSSRKNSGKQFKSK
ncbi:uncharacterized protein LOC131228217 isoform X1 [Magnolia sinica]|uniref:uncharacterized protein LOC131228217 isoform X1 n=2 Tax=Magnolia sinica TaxID=86752 RepID=UPI002658CB2F|nr:uncharacterized protein LOC131228217 isoform X1 [Magnolia sinica]